MPNENLRKNKRGVYSGKYHVKNLQKYIGPVNPISFRSMWERQAFKWCEENADIVKWSSESVVIPYLCETDQNWHEYYVDLFIEFSNGRRLLVEIKPKKETVEPKKGRKSDARFLEESLTYKKNTSKWKFARNFAKQYNMRFEIWTEDDLRDMGMKIL